MLEEAPDLSAPILVEPAALQDGEPVAEPVDIGTVPIETETADAPMVPEDEDMTVENSANKRKHVSEPPQGMTFRMHLRPIGKNM